MRGLAGDAHDASIVARSAGGPHGWWRRRRVGERAGWRLSDAMRPKNAKALGVAPHPAKLRWGSTRLRQRAALQLVPEL
jgi:hypothetical protein